MAAWVDTVAGMEVASEAKMKRTDVTDLLGIVGFIFAIIALVLFVLRNCG